LRAENQTVLLFRFIIRSCATSFVNNHHIAYSNLAG
jgi:hypothetical protein